MTLNWQFPEAGLIADQKLRTSLNHTVNISLLLKLSAYWSQRSCETCFFGLEEEKNKTAVKIMFSMKKHHSFNSSFLLLWFSKRLESIAEMITGGNYRFMFLMSEWIYTQTCHLPFHILQKIRHTCFLHQQKSLKINFFFLEEQTCTYCSTQLNSIGLHTWSQWEFPLNSWLLRWTCGYDW